MTTATEYAVLSLYVYSSTIKNKTELPPGWELAESLHPDNALGFSYGVFRRTGSSEIVLAYAGTNQGVDWIANVTTAIGLSSTQATQAAVAYLQAKALYGSNITFTGHSLGGGLASVLAVWFDRPATVFDEAPFELTARNPAFAAITKAALALAGYSDPAFNAYTGLFDFSAREAKVTNYYASEEALQIARILWPTVLGTDNRVEFGVGNMLARRVDLHSQALLTAGLLSEAFRQATVTVQRTLPVLMDTGFYAYDTATSAQQNVLINFIRSEQGPGDKLTHFAADLNKLGTNIAGLNVRVHGVHRRRLRQLQTDGDGCAPRKRGPPSAGRHGGQRPGKQARRRGVGDGREHGLVHELPQVHPLAQAGLMNAEATSHKVVAAQ